MCQIQRFPAKKVKSEGFYIGVAPFMLIAAGLWKFREICFVSPSGVSILRHRDVGEGRIMRRRT